MGSFLFPYEVFIMCSWKDRKVGKNEVGKIKKLEIIYRGRFIGPIIGTFGAKSRLDRVTSFILRPPCDHVARSLDGRPPILWPFSPTVPIIAFSILV